MIGYMDIYERKVIGNQKKSEGLHILVLCFAVVSTERLLKGVKPYSPNSSFSLFEKRFTTVSVFLLFDAFIAGS